MNTAENYIQEIQIHLNDFATESCSVGHDINNALAILMGYMDELQSNTDAGDFDKERFQFMLKKMNVGIDRLQKISKTLNDARLEKRQQEVLCNLRDYTNKWFKLLVPFFKSKNLVVQFTTETDDLMYMCKRWYINHCLNHFFAQALSINSTEQETHLQVKFFAQADSINLKMETHNTNWKFPATYNWQGVEYNIVQEQNTFILQLACKSV